MKNQMQNDCGFIRVELISGVIRGCKVLDVMINKLGYDILE